MPTVCAPASLDCTSISPSAQDRNRSVSLWLGRAQSKKNPKWRICGYNFGKQELASKRCFSIAHFRPFSSVQVAAFPHVITPGPSDSGRYGNTMYSKRSYAKRSFAVTRKSNRDSAALMWNTRSTNHSIASTTPSRSANKTYQRNGSRILSNF